MMLNKNTKVKVHSLDGDIDFSDIVAVVLLGITWNPYLFWIWLDHILQMSIVLHENRQEPDNTPAQIITDADSADDLALLANTHTQAKSPLYSLEQAADGVHVNADKMENVF